MKKLLMVVLLLLVASLGVFLFLNKSSVIAPDISTVAPPSLTELYPEGFAVDENYTYQALGEAKEIPGVKFTIPSSLSKGTNLSSDSYISVETINSQKECSADLFLDGVKTESFKEGTVEYSVASTTGAGAGNRYHEIVYALPSTSPCRAIRYFIHYSVFENYPTGTIKEFNEGELITQFDGIRKTLILAL